MKHFFDGVPSAADGKYTPAAARIRAGLNSGKHLVEGTRDCPAKVDAYDCEGAWLAWGGCQTDGVKVERWTTEQFATGTGKECEDADGSERRVACTPTPTPAPPPPPPVACAADYGTNKPCCGQPGDPVPTSNECRKDRPICRDYAYNHHFGKCFSK